MNKVEISGVNTSNLPLLSAEEKETLLNLLEKMSLNLEKEETQA